MISNQVQSLNDFNHIKCWQKFHFAELIWTMHTIKFKYCYLGMTQEYPCNNNNNNHTNIPITTLSRIICISCKRLTTFFLNENKLDLLLTKFSFMSNYVKNANTWLSSQYPFTIFYNNYKGLDASEKIHDPLFMCCPLSAYFTTFQFF